MGTATDLADEIVKAAIFDIGLKAVETAAIAESPWLGLPVVKQIFELILKGIGNKIFEALSNSIDFQIINLQTEEQKRQYENAVSILKATTQKPGVTPDELSKAKDELRARLSALIHIK